jgi:hypothetical protein
MKLVITIPHTPIISLHLFIGKLTDENTLIALRDEYVVPPSCVGVDISSLLNGYESPQQSKTLPPPHGTAGAGHGDGDDDDMPVSTQGTSLLSPKASFEHSQSTELPHPLPQRRRSCLNDFYQNDSMRRTISGSSTHSREANQNDKWEWDNILAMMKLPGKGEEFVTLPRNVNMSTSDVIDVSSLLLFHLLKKFLMTLLLGQLNFCEIADEEDDLTPSDSLELLYLAALW